MSTTDKQTPDQHTTQQHIRTARQPRSGLPPLTATQLAGITVAVIVAAVIWAVGLPSSPSVFGTPASELTAPLALFVVFAGISLVGALGSRSSGAAWRVVDIVVAAVLGVAGGFFFWGVATIWTPITTPLAFYPPASALLAGLWLVPGVVGALVIRRPGAAVFTELVAAVLEALLGNQWGFSTVYYGLVEGLGAEFVVALFLYRRFGLPTALLTGAGAGVAVGLLDTFVYYPDFSAGYKSAYVVLAIVSGAVIAGIGGWALTRALARTGALAPLASGRAAERV